MSRTARTFACPLLFLAALVVAPGQAAASMEVCSGKTDAPLDKRFEACTAIIDDPAAAETDRSVALAHRARWWLFRRNPAAAEKDIAAALALNPKNHLALGRRAFIKYLRRQHAAAIRDLDQAIAIAPRTGEYYHYRALNRYYIALREGDPALQRKVIADASRALELGLKGRRRAGAYFTRGAAHGRLFREDMKVNRAHKVKALADLMRSIELATLKSDRARGWFEIAQLHAWREQGAEALRRAGTAFDKAVELAPGLYQVLQERGEFRARVKQWQGAARDFRQVIRLKPDHWLGHLLLSGAQEKAGDKAGALATLDHVLGLIPGCRKIIAGGSAPESEDTKWCVGILLERGKYHIRNGNKARARADLTIVAGSVLTHEARIARALMERFLK